MMVTHILIDEKFTDSFVNFVNKNFNTQEHIFLIMCHKTINYVKCQNNWSNVFLIKKSPIGLLKVIFALKKSQKIILHGLFSKVILKLFSKLKFSKKSFWYIWGGDLYSFSYEDRKIKKLKTKLISHLKGIITPFEMDYDVACREYDAKCKCYKAILPNCIVEPKIESLNECDKSACLNILVGNSADSENNHFEILNILREYLSENIKVYIPLNYGDKAYAKEVAQKFKDVLGEKAFPILSFMPFEEYKKLINSIDVALFAHKRQQAFGNTVLLLANGTKIYMNSNTSIWKWAKNLDVSIFDIIDAKETMMKPLSNEERKNNYETVYANINQSAVVSQWKDVFDLL